MSPREMRLRQRIDTLMDRCEELEKRYERDRRQKHRLESRISWYKRSRDFWRDRCGEYRYEASLGRRRQRRVAA